MKIKNNLTLFYSKFIFQQPGSGGPPGPGINIAILVKTAPPGREKVPQPKMKKIAGIASKRIDAASSSYKKLEKMLPKRAKEERKKYLTKELPETLNRGWSLMLELQKNPKHADKFGTDAKRVEWLKKLETSSTKEFLEELEKARKIIESRKKAIDSYFKDYEKKKGKYWQDIQKQEELKKQRDAITDTKLRDKFDKATVSTAKSGLERLQKKMLADEKAFIADAATMLATGLKPFNDYNPLKTQIARIGTSAKEFMALNTTMPQGMRIDKDEYPTLSFYRLENEDSATRETPEEAKGFEALIKRIKATNGKVEIFLDGFASVDGGYKSNKKLAGRRAENMRERILNELKKDNVWFGKYGKNIEKNLKIRKTEVVNPDEVPPGEVYGLISKETWASLKKKYKNRPKQFLLKVLQHFNPDVIKLSTVISAYKKYAEIMAKEGAVKAMEWARTQEIFSHGNRRRAMLYYLQKYIGNARSVKVTIMQKEKPEEAKEQVLPKPGLLDNLNVTISTELLNKLNKLISFISIVNKEKKRIIYYISSKVGDLAAEVIVDVKDPNNIKVVVKSVDGKQSKTYTLKDFSEKAGKDILKLLYPLPKELISKKIRKFVEEAKKEITSDNNHYYKLESKTATVIPDTTPPIPNTTKYLIYSYDGKRSAHVFIDAVKREVKIVSPITGKVLKVFKEGEIDKYKEFIQNDTRLSDLDKKESALSAAEAEEKKKELVKFIKEGVEKINAQLAKHPKGKGFKVSFYDFSNGPGVIVKYKGRDINQLFGRTFPNNLDDSKALDKWIEKYCIEGLHLTMNDFVNDAISPFAPYNEAFYKEISREKLKGVKPEVTKNAVYEVLSHDGSKAVRLNIDADKGKILITNLKGVKVKEYKASEMDKYNKYIEERKFPDSCKIDDEKVKENKEAITKICTEGVEALQTLMEKRKLKYDVKIDDDKLGFKVKYKDYEIGDWYADVLPDKHKDPVALEEWVKQYCDTELQKKMNKFEEEWVEPLTEGYNKLTFKFMKREKMPLLKPEISKFIDYRIYSFDGSKAVDLHIDVENKKVTVKNMKGGVIKEYPPGKLSEYTKYLENREFDDNCKLAADEKLNLYIDWDKRIKKFVPKFNSSIANKYKIKFEYDTSSGYSSVKVSYKGYWFQNGYYAASLPDDLNDTESINSYVKSTNEDFEENLKEYQKFQKDIKSYLPAKHLYEMPTTYPGSKYEPVEIKFYEKLSGGKKGIEVGFIKVRPAKHTDKYNFIVELSYQKGATASHIKYGDDHNELDKFKTEIDGI